MNRRSMQSGLFPDAQRAYMAGNFARAEKYCRLQLGNTPGDRETKVLLGLALAKLAREREAAEVLEQVNRESPSFESHIALATIYFFVGDVDRALDEGEAAIGIDPRDPSGYNKVGHELVKLGRFEQAISYFRRALRYAPNDLDSNQNLAAALKDAGRSEESLEAWAQVTKLAPKSATAWLNYGMLQLSGRDLDAALAAGKRAIECDPRSVEAYMLAGLACSEMGRATEAGSYFEEALKRDPDHGLAQVSLGIVLQERGRFADSIRWLQRSLDTTPTNGLAYYIQVRSTKMSAADRPLIDKLKSLLGRGDLALLDRSYMHYALGKSYEDLKEFESAIRHFDAANEAAYEFWWSEKPWDVDRYRATIDRTVQAFSRDAVDTLRRDGLPSDLPTLIVGMIRSGTTLVEQILSSHPEVAGAGELTYWHERAGQCFDVESGTVDGHRLANLAAGYLNLLRGHDANAKRVTDKLPHNYALLGFIQPALPNAKIVHIRRSPIDNCLSVYTTAYARPPGFTLKRENILTAYLEYLRLMAHWRTALPPDRLLEIDYEDLIANPEPVIRRMLDFVGLEWSDRCLRPERNERTVHTPSAWQVRQPIYRTSVERWRNYEPWLREFRELRDVPRPA